MTAGRQVTASGKSGMIGHALEVERMLALAECARASHAEALVITGEAGQGKSQLLAWFEGAAADRGCAVLRVEGLEFGRDIPFGGLLQLLRPLLGRIDELPTAQRQALRGALGIDDAEAPVLTTYAATIALLSLAADARPVIVVVNDAQWVDRPSLETLVFAAQGVGGDALGFVFAHRLGSPSILGSAPFKRWELRGLDRRESSALLARQGVVPEVAARCHDLTAGNPLALIEGAKRLTEAQRSGHEPLPPALPIGDRLLDDFRDQLARLPRVTRRALALAVLEGDRDFELLLLALRELDLSLDDLELAEAGGFITVGSRAVVWRHPLMRAAVLRLIAPVEMRALNRALAESSFACGDERVAWFLAQSCPGADDDLAGRLGEVGSSAFRRGALAAAAEAFDEAARLSTTSDARSRYRFRAADARWGAGEYQRVVDDLAGVVGQVEDQVTAAHMGVVLGQAEIWSSGPTVARVGLEAQADPLASTEPALAAELWMHAAVARLLELDTRGARQIAQRAAEAVATTADPGLLLATGALERITIAFDGGPPDTLNGLVAIAQMSVAALDSGIAGVDSIAQLCAAALSISEEWTSAAELLRRVIRMGDDSGMVGRSLFARTLLADALWRSGRWSAALGEIGQVTSLQAATGLRHLVPFTHAVLARIEAGMGLVDAGREHARDAAQKSAELGLDIVSAWALSAEGLLELGVGRHREAANALDHVAVLAGHLAEPGWLWWQADAIEAWCALGRRRDAERLLEQLEAQATTTGRRWAVSAAHRSAGLLRDRGGEDHLDAAVDGFREMSAPFELGRALLVRGEHRLRHDHPRDAARDLAAARTIFDRLGARPWSERAFAAGGESRPELASITTALTPGELRVALAVGHGDSNRDAADRLFVSVKTVDTHLQSIYRKLTIRSRSQLTALVIADEVTHTSA